MLFSVRLALASNFQYFGWKQQVTLVFDLISVELRSVVWLNVLDWLVGMVPYQRDSDTLWINKISFYRNLQLPNVQHTVRELEGWKRAFAVILRYPPEYVFVHEYSRPLFASKVRWLEFIFPNQFMPFLGFLGFEPSSVELHSLVRTLNRLSYFDQG